jgi:hypothetical protein
MLAEEKTRRLEKACIKRALKKVKKQKHSHGTCWLYTGTLNDDGYAYSSVQSVTRILSRLILCLRDDLPYPLYKNPLEAGHRTPLLCKTGHRHCINPTHLEWETVAAGAVRRERDERWLAYRKEHGGTAEDAGVLEAKETTGKLTGKERG